MAVTTTTRLGLTRWSAGTDPLSRAQLDASHAALETNSAMYLQGTAAARPAFGVPGRFYFATDTKFGSYDTGTAWENFAFDVATTYATKTALTDGLATKANTAHSHAIGDLPVATSGTSSTTQVVRADDSRLSNARTPTAHTHVEADVTGLVADLAGKAAVSHSHAIGDLPVAASGVSNTTTVVRADDSRLSNARTPTAHTHTLTDLPDTQTALNGKAASTHSHGIGDLPVAASGVSSSTQLVRADDSRLAGVPAAHSHAIGDLPVAPSGTSNTTQLVRADDSRLSNSRTPVTHSHAIADLPVAASGVSSTTQVTRADDERLVYTGMMMVWPAATSITIPAGWLRCNGQSLSRTTYAALFAVIGTTWGAVDASSFTLPDMRQRMPLGSTGATGAAVLGTYGGSASRTILETNLPAHTHAMVHTHPIGHGHTASSGAAGNHAHTATSNNHDVNHYHYADTGHSGGHEHNYAANVNRSQYQSGGSFAGTYAEFTAGTGGGGGHSHQFNTGYMADNNVHGHTITVSTQPDHSHTVTVVASTATSGASSADATSPTGGNTALDTLNPYAAVDWLIKD